MQGRGQRKVIKVLGCVLDVLLLSCLRGFGRNCMILFGEDEYLESTGETFNSPYI